MGFFGEIVEDIVEAEIIEDIEFGGQRRRRGASGFRPGNDYGYGYNGPHIDVDPLNGDIIEDFGDGFGVDLDNGDLTVDSGPFGFDL